MQEIRIRFADFDFQRFADSILRFVHTVQWIVEPLEPLKYLRDHPVPEYLNDCMNYDVLINALEEGKSLFFAFSTSGIGNHNDIIECVNGEKYLLDDDGYENILILGETDCVGYLIKKQADELVINAAYFLGDWPAIEIAHCDVFDASMDEYIRGFEIL